MNDSAFYDITMLGLVEVDNWILYNDWVLYNACYIYTLVWLWAAIFHQEDINL